MQVHARFHCSFHPIHPPKCNCPGRYRHVDRLHPRSRAPRSNLPCPRPLTLRRTTEQLRSDLVLATCQSFVLSNWRLYTQDLPRISILCSCTCPLFLRPLCPHVETPQPPSSQWPPLTLPSKSARSRTPSACSMSMAPLLPRD